MWTQKVWSIFCESDGTPSFGRVGSFIALIAAVVWGSYFLFKNHVMPPLSEVTEFVSAPYLTNKVTTKLADTIGKFGKP